MGGLLGGLLGMVCILSRALEIMFLISGFSSNQHPAASPWSTQPQEQPFLFYPPPPPQVMVQINWILKTGALTNMQIEWRPKSAGKWHPFQWEAILHFPTAEGHRAVPSSVSRNGDCLHVWLTGQADLIRLFQKTFFRQMSPVTGDTVRFLYTLLSTPPCERRYA